MEIPSGLKFSKDHEWIRVEGDVAYVGISHHAQGELGDIVFVDINTVGELVQKDSVFGTVEAVKTVADLFMPVSGEVLELNELLEGSPELINQDPYSGGWIIKIRVLDHSEILGLMDSESYVSFIG
jgi:glycine cleavage system H protein